MASLPLLSIIIPVYNAEKYLNRCIDSIISSTYSNLEIIMVDDGSKDQSGSICDEYSEKDNRCRVYHTNNRGQAAARNYGLRKASGDYITFVDDDDWVDNSMYEKLINTAIETVVDLYVDIYLEKLAILISFTKIKCLGEAFGTKYLIAKYLPGGGIPFLWENNLKITLS